MASGNASRTNLASTSALTSCLASCAWTFMSSASLTACRRYPSITWLRELPAERAWANACSSWVALARAFCRKQH